MSALLEAAGDALARETGITPTQARGTLRLLLRDRGIDARIASRSDVLALLTGALPDALAKRHLPATRDVLSAIRRAVEAAPEGDDPLALFEDID